VWRRKASTRPVVVGSLGATAGSTIVTGSSGTSVTASGGVVSLGVVVADALVGVIGGVLVGVVSPDGEV
jgi:hypothetical protein